MKNLQSIISKKATIKITVKTVNDIASPDSLITTLLVFRAYLYIHNMDLPASSIIQKTATIDKIMNEV